MTTHLVIDWWGYEAIETSAGAFGADVNAGYGTIECEHHLISIHDKGFSECLTCGYRVYKMGRALHFEFADRSD